MSNKQPQLSKVLSRFDLLVLAFGAMIGWGWVVLSGQWITMAGSVGALIAFLVGGLLVTFIGLSFAELAAAIPRAGGELHYALKAFGRTTAFFTSWAVVLGYVSVVAFEAVALPTVIGYLFPSFKFGYLWTIHGWDVYASWVAIGMIGAIGMTALNYFGIKTASVIQIVLTIIIALVGLMLIAGSFYGGDTANLAPLFHHHSTGIMSVVIMTPFMFVGFGVIPQAAGEARVNPRAIGKIMLVAVVCAVVFYLAIILGVALSLGPDKLAVSKLASADAIGASYRSPLFSKILILGGVAGILTSWNGFIIGASRIIYAMADNAMLPACFGRLHKHHKTPANAIFLIGALSVLSPLLGRPMLVWLVDAGSLAVTIVWIMVVSSFLMLRKTAPTMPRPYRAGRSNIVGWIGLLLAFGVGSLYMPGMPSALGPNEWVIFGAWWFIGLLLYVKASRAPAAALSSKLQSYTSL